MNVRRVEVTAIWFRRSIGEFLHKQPHMCSGSVLEPDRDT